MDDSPTKPQNEFDRCSSGSHLFNLKVARISKRFRMVAKPAQEPTPRVLEQKLITAISHHKAANKRPTVIDRPWFFAHLIVALID